MQSLAKFTNGCIRQLAIQMGAKQPFFGYKLYFVTICLHEAPFDIDQSYFLKLVNPWIDLHTFSSLPKVDLCVDLQQYCTLQFHSTSYIIIMCMLIIVYYMYVYTCIYVHISYVQATCMCRRKNTTLTFFHAFYKQPVSYIYKIQQLNFGLCLLEN